MSFHDSQSYIGCDLPRRRRHFAAASFYLPYKVKKGPGRGKPIGSPSRHSFSWLIAPILIAYLLIITAIYHVPLQLKILQNKSTLRPACALSGFGVLWGVGGLTFGLSMRYLGIGLGYAVALGFCAAFGQIVPIAV